jgi:hypothetical protein
MRLSREGVFLTIKVFFISWLVMLGLRYCGVVKHPTVDLLTFALFGLFAAPFLMFFVISLMGVSHKGEVVDYVYEGNADAFGRYYSLVLILSSIYVVLVLVDKVFIGGVLSVGITVARYTAMEDGPRNSILGASHYFLAGAPAILACLLLSRRAGGVTNNMFCWALVLAGFGCFFLSGGRNGFVVGAVFVLFYFVLERIRFRLSGSLRKVDIPKWLIFFAILGICYVLYLFAERAAIRGTDMAGAIGLLSENYDVEVSSPAWLEGFALDIYYSVAYMVFYVTHAPTYVSQYIDSNYSPMLMGAYGFSILFRIFDAIAGAQVLNDAFDDLLIAGVYLTLPGTVFVDFGWIGVALSALLLVSVTVFMVSNALLKKSGSGLMAASLCLTIVALSPVFSGLSVGNGFSLLLLLPILRFFGVRENKSRIASH